MKLVKFAAICAAAVSLSAMAEDYSNTLAILPVAKALNAMPLTVNFTDANGEALSASNVVKTANLPAGSALYVYDGVSAYTKFNLSGTAWVPTNDGKKYVVNSSGQLVVGDAAAASDVHVARGAAVFLETPNESSPTFYLAGKPGSGTITTITSGANLIGAPTAAVFDLNSNTADWATIKPTTFTGNTATDKVVEVGDTIQVPSSDGGLSDVYYYRAKEDNQWGCWGKFVRSGRSSTFVTTGCTIPAGRGFWYLRADSSNMTITW